MNVEVNLLGVLLAAVAFMVLGFLWYGPMLFAKQWMKLKGYTQESLKKAQNEMGMWYAVSFVAALLTAYVLSHVMTLSESFFGMARVYTGLSTAFWMWLGFVMPVQLTGTIFGEKKWKLLAIDTGYQLVGLIVMAIVLALF